LKAISLRWLGHSVAWVAALLCPVMGRTDPLWAVQVLREGGCGGTLPAAQPVHHTPLLDRAAEQWARGSSYTTATQRVGYPAQSTAALHISGPDSAAIELLRRAGCHALADRNLRDIGVFQRGPDTWLVLASFGVSTPTLPRIPPPVTHPTPKVPTSGFANRVLQLVNEARERGARCGERSFAPVGTVRLSQTLDSVALGHATDMARNNYFEHEDLGGHSPADRVRAMGYPEKLVGENIAYGPETAEEVVQGWLDSPGHCENIMDPRFAEMGIAVAPGESSRHGLYWVQLLVAPRT
jgi:uncharacterized protein YkwD